VTKGARDLSRRYESARRRIESLRGLRELVALPPARDIARRQWQIIESQLATAEERLSAKLKAAARAYLPHASETETARKLNAVLGELELDMSTTFSFFDTYMDVLTQRHSPRLGRLLAGCDVLAWDAVHKDHPALLIVEPPLVYCDRGFGASTLREGVRLRHGIPNPMPLVQIPYSRLHEKCNLTSILHEVGHEAMVRLGFVSVLPDVFRTALERTGAPAQVREYFPIWSSEIGPDFWTFCQSGLAEAAAIQEILSLQPEVVFRLSGIDPHPPPYLRVLLSYEWCRQVWGAGIWDRWDERWRELYDESAATPTARVLIQAALPFLPVIAGALLRTRFRVLSGRRIPELFDLDSLAPARLAPLARTIGSTAFHALTPSAQLAVFRLAHEQGRISGDELDTAMTKWLIGLGETQARRLARGVMH
jgi:hypothetical protein